MMPLVQSDPTSISRGAIQHEIPAKLQLTANHICNRVILIGMANEDHRRPMANRHESQQELCELSPPRPIWRRRRENSRSTYRGQKNQNPSGLPNIITL